MKFRHLMKFESFANGDTTTKPTTRPTTKPTRPTRKSPIRRHKPAVDPKPKAELDDVLDYFDLEASDELKQEIDNHYKNQ